VNTDPFRGGVSVTRPWVRTECCRCFDAAVANRYTRAKDASERSRKKTMNPESIRRKLRGLVAVIQDSGATAAERDNARRLKAGLKAKLEQQGTPEGDWSDTVFRFGRALRRVKTSTAPPPSLSTGAAKVGFRLGRALRQVTKK
jgi:hypothetical protein